MLQFTSDKLIDFSHKLSRIHKAALPNAVRFTLNDAAEDVKFNTLQKNANKQFDVKKPSFFRAFSRFEKAQGFNISNMKSTAGMVKSADPKSVASTEIAKQQYAGTIPNKSYIIPTTKFKGRNTSGTAKKSALKFINKKPIKFTKDTRGHKFGNKKIKGTGLSNYIARHYVAYKENIPFLQLRSDDTGIIYKVTSFKKRKDGIKFKREPIAVYAKGKKVKLTKKHPFVINSAKESTRKINDFFIKNATKQIQRFK
jgi:hypothetical protein